MQFNYSQTSDPLTIAARTILEGRADTLNESSSFKVTILNKPNRYFPDKASADTFAKKTSGAKVVEVEHDTHVKGLQHSFDSSKEKNAHSAFMAKHGVHVSYDTSRQDDEMTYHGSHEAVKKAVINHYHGEESDAKSLHPGLFKESFLDNLDEDIKDLEAQHLAAIAAAKKSKDAGNMDQYKVHVNAIQKIRLAMNKKHESFNESINFNPAKVISLAKQDLKHIETTFKDDGLLQKTLVPISLANKGSLKQIRNYLDSIKELIEDLDLE